MVRRLNASKGYVDLFGQMFPEVRLGSPIDIMMRQKQAGSYSAKAAGMAADLTHRRGPVAPTLARIDPVLAQPVRLDEHEFQDLYKLLSVALTDRRAGRADFGKQVPDNLPSNRAGLIFQERKQ